MRNPLELAEGLLERLAALHIAVGAASGAWLLTVTAAPLYRLSGSYEGYVALSWYSLHYLGAPVHLRPLDVARVVSLAPLALSIYLLAAQPIMASRLRRLTAAELSVGGALAFLAIGFAPVAIAGYASQALEALTRTLTYTSSAGLVWLGSASVEPTPALRLLSFKVYMALAAVYTASAIAELDKALEYG